MARPYTNDIDDVTPYFPDSVYAAEGWKNRSNDYLETPETFTVPDELAVELQYAILKQTEFTVSDETDVDTLIVVPHGQVPGAAEVAVNFDTGLLEFHSSRLGNTIEVTYTPIGSAVTSARMNRIEVELEAIETYLDSTAKEPHSCFLFGVPSTTSGFVVGSMLIPDDGTGARSIVRINAFAGDRVVSSGQTVIYVTTATTATGGSSVTLPSAGADLVKARITGTTNIALDTSGGPVWVNVFCTDNSAGHQNITVEIWVE